MSDTTIESMENLKKKMKEKKMCSSCGTYDTPLWRSGPQGAKTMCNACGIKWKRKTCQGKRRRRERPLEEKSKKNSFETIETQKELETSQVLLQPKSSSLSKEKISEAIPQKKDLFFLPPELNTEQEIISIIRKSSLRERPQKDYKESKEEDQEEEEQEAPKKKKKSITHQKETNYEFYHPVSKDLHSGFSITFKNKEQELRQNVFFKVAQFELFCWENELSSANQIHSYEKQISSLKLKIQEKNSTLVNLLESIPHQETQLLPLPPDILTKIHAAKGLIAFSSS